MLILLAPAKTLDFTTPAPTKESSIPLFQAEANNLADKFAAFSRQELSYYMKISEKLATENLERYRDFKKAPEKQAIFAYNGDVYRDIEASDYTPSQLKSAQQHLRILSGLYGILKPLDLIKPHRLEMSLSKNFWKNRLTQALKNETSQLILNLASKEYTSPIDFRQLHMPLVTCHFKTGSRIIPIFSKIARGTMANYIIKKQLTKVEDLKNFTEDGWEFDSEQSDASNFVFTKEKC